MFASAAPNPQTARRLWGLAVRSERALRATAPLWLAQRAAWGDAACLLASIKDPVYWLTQGILLKAVQLPASASLPLARLLLSCAATELKAAGAAVVQPGSWIFCFTEAAVFSNSIAAMSPILVSFLLPRLASTISPGGSLFANDALSFVGKLCQAMCGDASLASLLVLTSCHSSVLLGRSVAEVDIFSQQVTRQQAHLAVMTLACHATQILQTSLFLIQLEHGRLLLSSKFRASLAQPILSLLCSPLLGLLASLQHTTVGGSFPRPRSLEGSDIPPVHLLPAHMEPDETDSGLAMQVGQTTSLCYSLLATHLRLLNLFEHSLAGLGADLLPLPGRSCLFRGTI